MSGGNTGNLIFGPFDQLEKYYHLNYTTVSLIFISPSAGYAFAAFASDRIHMSVGQRGVAIIGPLCRLASYITLSLHPPWPAAVVVLVLAGFGNGILDAAWNAWVGDMVGANELLGIMHGFYGLGATASPLIATVMVTEAALQWYTFFYLMCGLGVLELTSGTWAFWGETAMAFRRKNASGHEQGRLKAVLKSKVTWICSLFLLIYVGSEGKLQRGCKSMSFAFLTLIESNSHALDQSLLSSRRSFHRRLDRHVYDPRAWCESICVGHDGDGLLARHHLGPRLPRVPDTQTWRATRRLHLSRARPRT